VSEVQRTTFVNTPAESNFDGEDKQGCTWMNLRRARIEIAGEGRYLHRRDTLIAMDIYIHLQKTARTKSVSLPE
jgi:hypothetical protein